MKIIFAVANAVAALVLCGALPHTAMGNVGAVGGILWFATACSFAVYWMVMWSEKEDADHINLPADWDDWNVGDQQWYIHNMNLAGFDFEGTAKELPKEDEPMLLSKQEIRDALGRKPPIMFHDNALMQSRYAEDWYRARDKELRAKGYTVIESPPNVILPTSWTNQQEDKPIYTRPMPPKGGGGVGNIYARPQRNRPAGGGGEGQDRKVAHLMDHGKPFPHIILEKD